jgi:8-oxo-dGTP pyrophosphatase MutT (NUDIX family)
MVHTAGVVVYKLENGTLYFLVQGVESLDPRFLHLGIQNRFPGGSNEDHPEEDPFATAKRECEEETHLHISSSYEPDLIRQSQGSGPRKKFFYLVPFDKVEGDLRTEPIMDGKDILHVPQWKSGTEISQGVYYGGGQIYRTHRQIFEFARILALQRIRESATVGV